LRQRFFGGNAAICPTRPVAAVENPEGQLSVYDLETGRKTDELQFSSAVAYAVFGRDGKKLFVLTADQTYYLFNVDGLALK
ncbi:MAG: hypothetical protein JSS81_26430, partial [Acidobacteria bacterium]|nr:hypothetical protein [Acidobacteriota bacterium]